MAARRAAAKKRPAKSPAKGAAKKAPAKKRAAKRASKGAAKKPAKKRAARGRSGGGAPLRLAIHGFGRIGRLVLRELALREAGEGGGAPAMEVVAVAGVSDPALAAHLFKYDSVHGTAPFPVALAGQRLRLGGARGAASAGGVRARSIPLFAERAPARAPWRAERAEIVLDCSGAHKTAAALKGHLAAGAGAVVVSAPAEGAEAVIVRGVNDEALVPKLRIISAASCTTNALAPLADVLDRAFSLRRGFATAVHAYTADQRLIDASHRDLRRARAAGLSIVPASSGGAAALGRVLPRLAGRIDAAALRVPVADASFVSLEAEVGRDADEAAVNRAFAEAAALPRWQGVLGIAPAPLVSADFIGERQSAVQDPYETRVVARRFVRVAAWYDNERAFACRMLDLAARLGANVRG